MVILEPHAGPYARPLPELNGFNAPFVEGLRRYQFHVPKCQACGHYHWTPYPACRTCLSEAVTWTPVSGDAQLYSYTVVHRGVGPFAADAPYVVAMGELVEQPRPCLVIAPLIGVAPRDVYIGQPLQIGFMDIPDMQATTFHWVLRH